jgi:hypothetical protein
MHTHPNVEEACAMPDSASTPAESGRGGVGRSGEDGACLVDAGVPNSSSRSSAQGDVCVCVCVCVCQCLCLCLCMCNIYIYIYI